METQKHVLPSPLATPQAPHPRLAIALATQKTTPLRYTTNKIADRQHFLGQAQPATYPLVLFRRRHLIRRRIRRRRPSTTPLEHPYRPHTPDRPTSLHPIRRGKPTRLLRATLVLEVVVNLGQPPAARPAKVVLPGTSGRHGLVKVAASIGSCHPATARLSRTSGGNAFPPALRFALPWGSAKTSLTGSSVVSV